MILSMNVTERILEAVYPSTIYCISCGAIIDKTRPYGLCDECMPRFQWVGKETCLRCGRERHPRNNHPLCYDCQSKEAFFDRGYTCAGYGLYERALISDFKFGDQSHLGRKIGEMMAGRIARESLNFQWILGVPLHRDKERKREYNQVELLGKTLARRLKIPYCGDVLVRNRWTPAMKHLDAYDRERNVQGAFSVISDKKSKLNKQRILLIDDIYTTGSTLNACSKTLKEEARVKDITILTFAAGPDRPPQQE